MSRISPPEMSTVLARAIERGLLDERDTSLMFCDLGRTRRRIAEIRDAFPDSAIHALAVKANPLARLLARFVDEGAALEVASLAELELAAELGAGTIVFDSPAKTVAELRRALDLGAVLNADNEAELGRIAKLLELGPAPVRIGLRVNPQVGAGTIPTTAVASQHSKFGVALDRAREVIVPSFVEYPWLRGLHVHAGSQGMDVAALVEGVRRVVELADEIDRAIAPRRVEVIDIGGGLPVAYRSADAPPSVRTYATALREAVPELFGDRFTLITEFGRYVHANAGWVASRIEYVKRGEPATIVSHVGADLFLRRAYAPEHWFHELDLTDARGRLRRGSIEEYREYAVAGPLCFAADFLSRAVSLPEASEGDYLLVRDAGAYTLSMWSRYNSRASPKVIGYEDEGQRFELLRPRETIDEVLRFWRGEG